MGKMTKKEERYLHRALEAKFKQHEEQGAIIGYFAGIETIYNLILGKSFEEDLEFIDLPKDFVAKPFTLEEIKEFCKTTLKEGEKRIG